MMIIPLSQQVRYLLLAGFCPRSESGTPRIAKESDATAVNRPASLTAHRVRNTTEQNPASFGPSTLEGMRRFQSSSSVDEQTLVDLIERAQHDSEPSAFEGLYLLFANRIFQFLYSQLENVESAEEITSQVFVRLIEKIHLYRIAPVNNVSNFMALLKQIAYNLMVDTLRAHKRVRYTELEVAEEIPAESRLDEELAFGEVLQELKSLNDLQHDVIVLRFLEDLSIAETAEIMQKTEGAVKALQHRALESLRRQLTRRDTHDLRKHPRSLYRST